MIGLLILLGIALALVVALVTTMMAWQMVHPPRHTAGWALARGLPCDPNDLKLKFEEWWLDRPGGIRLPVWEIESGQRSAVSSQKKLGWHDLRAAMVVDDQHGGTPRGSPG